MKSFTTIAAIVLLIVAAAHVYRLVTGLSVVIGGYPVPLWFSGVGAAGAGLLAVLMFVEGRRR